MEFFFAKDFTGSPFTSGQEHLLAMAILIALNIALLPLKIHLRH
jgi:hypothetical protein